MTAATLAGLLERLRTRVAIRHKSHLTHLINPDGSAAAKMIEAQAGRIAALGRALEPFAARAADLNPNTDDAEWLDSEELGMFQAGHFRRAALTLKENDDVA